MVRMSLFGLGLPELVVIGGVAAVLFGPSKLPELGKSLGKTVKSFQEGANVSRGAFGSRGGFSGDPRRWFFFLEGWIMALARSPCNFRRPPLYVARVRVSFI